MKRATLATTITAAAVLVGGGAIGAYALANQDSPAPVETIAATGTPTPEATPDATPTAEPTPPVSVEPLETPEPQTPEQEFLRMAGEQVRGYGYEITDDELLSAGQFACDEIAAHPEKLPTEIFPIEGVTDSINAGFVVTARDYLCP